MVITIRKVIIMSSVLIAAMLLVTFLYGQIPVYMVGLPEDVYLTDDLPISQVSFYKNMMNSDTSDPHIIDMIAVAKTLHNTTFKEFIYTFHYESLSAESIELIGYKGDTLYVLVTWSEFDSEPYGYRSNLDEWQGSIYNRLTLSLTSIAAANAFDRTCIKENTLALQQTESVVFFYGCIPSLGNVGIQK